MESRFPKPYQVLDRTHLISIKLEETSRTSNDILWIHSVTIVTLLVSLQTKDTWSTMLPYARVRRGTLWIKYLRLAKMLS